MTGRRFSPLHLSLYSLKPSPSLTSLPFLYFLPPPIMSHLILVQAYVKRYERIIQVGLYGIGPNQNGFKL